MFLHKLVDIPVRHLFQHYHGPIFEYLHAKKRQDVGIIEAFPCHNFLAASWPLGRKSEFR